MSAGKPLDEYVISNHYVSSWFECSSKCLDILECVAFSHLTGSTQQSRHDINCEILKSKSEFGVSRGEDEAWTTYEVRSPGVVSVSEYLYINKKKEDVEMKIFTRIDPHHIWSIFNVFRKYVQHRIFV